VSEAETPEGMPALSLEDVAVCYSRRGRLFARSHHWALHGVSLDVLHGETLGVIGGNAAGKSTVMRVLAGIIKPDRGSLRNHGVVASLHSLNVGVVPHLTGRENAVLSGILLGLRRREINARMEAIRDFSGLGEFLDQPVAVYSSGMRARLGFSVAFQAEPDVLLVDEVWGVGDEAFRRKSTQAMQEMARSNRTVVIVSHGLDLIRRFCSRVVWLEDGRTRAIGPPGEIVDAYEQASQATNQGTRS
jgi:lipopolysaccharide transport system ATP-binding protein